MIERRLVLDSQKQTIASTIRAIGLRPSDFDWTETRSKYTVDLSVSKLWVPGSHYHFIFDYKDGKPYVLFSPGGTSTVGAEYSGSWMLAFQALQRWLGFLKRELEAVDPWSGAFDQVEPSDVPAPAISSTERFTAEDVAAIKVALSSFMDEIRSETQLTREDIAKLQEGVDFLVEQAATQSKQSWILMAFGTVLQFLLSAPQAQSLAGRLLSLFTTALKAVSSSLKLSP